MNEPANIITPVPVPMPIQHIEKTLPLSPLMAATTTYMTQNDLLLDNLLKFYYQGNNTNLEKMLEIITGRSHISLRIVDWFATNYAKKKETHYTFMGAKGTPQRFKVYNDYKLKLKAYSKKRFDPFCRWERTRIPYHNNTVIETTIGQLNFFKWAIENKILEYISDHFELIEKDMNSCNTVARRKERSGSVSGTNSSANNVKTDEIESIPIETVENTISPMAVVAAAAVPVVAPATYNVETITGGTTTMKDLSGIAAKTRKKRQELSIAAMKTIRHEKVEVEVKFR